MKLWTGTISQESGQSSYTLHIVRATSEALVKQDICKILAKDTYLKKYFPTADPYKWKADYGAYCGPYQIHITSEEIK